MFDLIPEDATGSFRDREIIAQGSDGGPPWVAAVKEIELNKQSRIGAGVPEYQLMIGYLPVAALKPYARIARTHSKKQIRQVAESIRTFGFNVPILIDGGNTILAGHARIEAARDLGMTEVPCVRLEHMGKAGKQAFILADNKLAQLAGWDEDLLAQELIGLQSLDPDFDIGITGFTVGEIDGLAEGLTIEDPGNPEDGCLPDLAPDCAVTQPGGLWIMGPHRLLCGSALSAGDCGVLMGEDKAQFVITDPPYNVPVAGHVSGLGATKHREFAMASGEMTRDAFTTFLGQAMGNLASGTVPSADHAAAAGVIAGQGDCKMEPPEVDCRVDRPFDIIVTSHLLRCGKQVKLMLGTDIADLREPNPRLVDLVLQARRWFAELSSGKRSSIGDVAKTTGVDRTYISRLITLAFLAPDIAERIVIGDHSPMLTPERLRKACPLPQRWDEQRALIIT